MSRAVLILPRSTGEGDRRRRWRGRLWPRPLEARFAVMPVSAPSTMLRMVPLPRFAGEDRK